MFFREIQVTHKNLQDLLATDLMGVFKYMSLYSSRRFYIGDTEINRKTLKDWEISGLLPYEYKEAGWRKFSFVEWVWLECIAEFRRLGVSKDKIKEIIKILFQVDAGHFVSRKNIETYEGDINQKEEILEAFDNEALTTEAIIQELNASQISDLLLVILTIVLTDQNLCLVYNNNDFCTFFIMGAGDEEIRKNNKDVFANLMNESFFVVNLRKIVNKIFQKPELRHNDNFILDFLSPKEKKIVDEIRGKNAKEITITFSDENEPTHIKVNRNQISNATLNKVARYLKKGKYQSVAFTTRDGHLIKYDETDSIKL